jgi:hypothetical protein
MKKGILSCSILAFIVACGGSEPGPGSGESSLGTAATFCQAWGHAACNAGVVDACGGDDAEACVASQQSFCLDLLPYGYQPKFAQECLDAVEAAYSDANLSAEELTVVLQLGEPCDRLIKGIGAANASCAESTDCNTLDGLRCVVKPGETQGTCQVPVEVGGGDRCSAPEQFCADGYYCSGSNCIATKELGEACGFDTECSPEHRCTATADAAGECVERLDDAEPCTADGECQSNLCAISRTTMEGICVSDIRLSAVIPICENLR